MVDNYYIQIIRIIQCLRIWHDSTVHCTDYSTRPGHRATELPFHSRTSWNKSDCRARLRVRDDCNVSVSRKSVAAPAAVVSRRDATSSMQTVVYNITLRTRAVLDLKDRWSALYCTFCYIGHEPRRGDTGQGCEFLKDLGAFYSPCPWSWTSLAYRSAERQAHYST